MNGIGQTLCRHGNADPMLCRQCYGEPPTPEEWKDRAWVESCRINSTAEYEPLVLVDIIRQAQEQARKETIVEYSKIVSSQCCECQTNKEKRKDQAFALGEASERAKTKVSAKWERDAYFDAGRRNGIEESSIYAEELTGGKDIGIKIRKLLDKK